MRTRDEHDRFILVLLSEELNRFFISQIGQVEEVLQIKVDKPRKALTDGGPKNRPHVMATEPMKNEARVLAHAAELVLAQFEGRYLLPSGGLELRTAVMQYLPKHMPGNGSAASSRSKCMHGLRMSLGRPSRRSGRSKRAKKF